ncbi:hypothetical protein GCM10009760_53090 [Kitasatospora kazusensis]|uniref:Uncharacterized protein n=1 Tax=Kitasatospora kazusensis TaxID=407974 RepID=A0ABP5LY16_9ACTN
MNTTHSPLPVGPVDQLLAQAALDPRTRPTVAGPQTFEDTLAVLTDLWEAMQLRSRRALPAAPRRPQLQPGPPRVVMVDEGALLIGQSRSGKQSPEVARLIRELLAVGRTTRIND